MQYVFVCVFVSGLGVGAGTDYFFSRSRNRSRWKFNRLRNTAVHTGMQCCGADTFLGGAGSWRSRSRSRLKTGGSRQFWHRNTAGMAFLVSCWEILGSLTFIIYCAISIHLCRAGSFRSLCVLTRVRWCTVHCTVQLNIIEYLADCYLKVYEYLIMMTQMQKD